MLPDWEQYYLPYSALKNLLSVMKKLAKVGGRELASLEGLLASTDLSFCGRLDEVGPGVLRCPSHVSRNFCESNLRSFGGCGRQWIILG